MGAARSHRVSARPPVGGGRSGAQVARRAAGGARGGGDPAAAAVRQRVNQGIAQPALVVGAASDRAEVEADRTADRVLRMPEPAAAAPPASPTPEGAARREVRREGQGGQPTTDELAKVPPLSEEEQEPSVGPNEDVAIDSLDAADMGEVESGEPEGGEGGEGGGAGGAGGGGEGGEGDGAAEEPEVRAKAADGGVGVGAEGGAAPPDAARAIRSPGSGRPLPGAVRGFMEPRFGADFSGVRLHDQAGERRVARRIGARAFTYGPHVWLGPQESTGDRRLMAHELTHVVQQVPAVRRARPAPAETPRETGEQTPEIQAQPRRVQRGWLMEKLEPYARKVPGYTLFTVILGKSPLTGKRVERTASNLIGGLLGLIPGGTDIYEKLKESGALDKAFRWVQDRINAFPITWARVKRAAEQAWDDFSFLDLSLAPVRRAFRPLFDDLVAYVKETAQQLLEFAVKAALAAAGPLGEKIWSLIAKGRDTILLVLKNPAGFALNLLKAVKSGFAKFYANIAKHLKQGVMGWLFGAMQGLNITLPEKLDLKGIISLAMQILQVTYQAFRKILVKRLQPHGEKKVGFMEGAFKVLKTLIAKGFAGVWKMMVNFLSLDRIMGVVIGGIRNFVAETVVKQAISWAASLSNPVGGIVRIAIAIYNVIEVFLERLEQIRDFAMSIFDSIANIAAGKLEQAATYVEQTMARMVPLIISFIAGVLGLGGITDKIQEIIKRIRKPVHKAMDRFVGFVVKKAKKLLAKLLSKLNGKRKLPATTFKIGATTHKYYAKKAGKSVALYVQTQEGKVGEKVTQAQAQQKEFSEKSESRPESQETLDALKTGAAQDEKTAAKTDFGSTTKSTRKGTQDLQTSMDKTAAAVTKAGSKLAGNPDAGTDDPKLLIRAIEPRFPIEGDTAQYSELKKKSGEAVPGSQLTYSEYYEADHMPEKSLLQHVGQWLPRLGSGGDAAAGGTDGAVTPAAPGKPDAADAVRGSDSAGAGGAGSAGVGASGGKGAAGPPAPTGFNELGARADKVGGSGEKLHAILLYRPIHRTKPNDFSKPTIGKIEKILAGSKPPAAKEAAVKEAIQTQLQDEAAAVKKLYGEDEGAAGATRKKVLGNLNALIEQTNTLYNLNAKALAAKEGEEGTDAGAAGRKALAFGGPENFMEREGTYGSYSSLAPTGPFFERDHIVDKSYPLALKGLTFAHDAVWAKSGIELKDKQDTETPDQAARRKRQNTLRRQLLFSSAAGVQSYTEGNGVAMMLYRPVHRAVTAATASGGALGDLVGGLSAAAFGKAKTYVEAGGVKMGDVKDEVRKPIRKTFGEQTRQHEQAVRQAYLDSIGQAAAANPGNAVAAERAMKTIVKRVHGNLIKMRSESLALLD